MNSYWVQHAIPEKYCETTTSLKICYLFNISQEKVYRSKISNIDELKRHINSEWAALSHTVIECALAWWHQRLCTCARAGDGHFEHML